MKCPRCEQEKTYVLKTTVPTRKPLDCKKRRRTCSQCKRPYMTYEIQEADFDRLCALIKSEGPTRSPLNAHRMDKLSKEPEASDS